MIVFIIPLKSKSVAKDWKTVCDLFQKTLMSVCNQTDSNFQVIVVCHERPEIDFHHPQVMYVEVDFAPPVWIQDNYDGKKHLEARRDHKRKLWIGLQYASEFQPCHIMFVDADDYISQHIAEFVNQRSDQAGWYVDQGYEYQEKTQKIYLRKNFHQRCGTSHIVRHDFLRAKSIDFNDVTGLYLRHQKIVSELQENHITLERLPFIGAVYTIDNNENMRSQTKYFLQRNRSILKIMLFYTRNIYKSIFSKPLTPTIQEEFGMNKIVESLIKI